MPICHGTLSTSVFPWVMEHWGQILCLLRLFPGTSNKHKFGKLELMLFMPFHERYAISLEQQLQCVTQIASFSTISTSTNADSQRRTNSSILTRNGLNMTKLFYNYSRWFKCHQRQEIPRCMIMHRGSNPKFHGWL